ncbi:hypothetical protein GMRT_12575 [Giardia muris]|uniref:Uncharacterized protein n=1 Tax=Giardia muris TaxID=5742 RepID=A0A4Z1T3B4_GIAMU|nr:hypothetical protein GMRT_12575 [Giardia muris]|eukprot:TNJ28443.1 hypothetical protein GMRT_12575 [Giardia muris]
MQGGLPYAPPRFAKERGCRTLVISPGGVATRAGLASDAEPLSVHSFVAIRQSGEYGQHEYHFPLLYEEVMLHTLANGIPDFPIGDLAPAKRAHPRDSPLFDALDETVDDVTIEEADEGLVFGEGVTQLSPGVKYGVHALFCDGGHLNVDACDSLLQYLTLLERYIAYLFERVVRRYEAELTELAELTGAFVLNQAPVMAQPQPHPAEDLTGPARSDEEAGQVTTSRPKSKRRLVQVREDETIVADIDICTYQTDDELGQITTATSNLYGSNNRTFLPTRARIQLFHKRRRLNYLAAPYTKGDYLIALCLPDDVTQAEVSLWLDVIRRLGFGGMHFCTQSNLAYSLHLNPSVILLADNTTGKATIVDSASPSLHGAHIPLPWSGNVFLATVILSLISLHQTGSNDYPELTAFAGAIHNSLLFSLFTPELSLLYFQGLYVQVLERLTFPDKDLQGAYLEACTKLSQEQGEEAANSLAACLLRQLFLQCEFNLRLCLTKCSFSPLASGTSITTTSTSVGCNVTYPWRFLQIPGSRYVVQQKLRIQFGYLGVVLGALMVNGWLFQDKEIFPILFQRGTSSSSSLETVHVEDCYNLIRFASEKPLKPQAVVETHTLFQARNIFVDLHVESIDSLKTGLKTVCPPRQIPTFQDLFSRLLAFGKQDDRGRSEPRRDLSDESEDDPAEPTVKFDRADKTKKRSLVKATKGSVTPLHKNCMCTGYLAHLPGLIPFLATICGEDMPLESCDNPWIDENFRGPKAGTLEWLALAWSSLCDSGVEAFLSPEELNAMGLRSLMERSLFMCP